MTDEARNKIFHKLRAAIDRVANDPGAEWFSGAHWDVMAWINDDLVAFESRVRAEVAREPIRVIAVVNWHTGRVHGITCDQELAQKWVREIGGRYDDDHLSASMTVDLVTPAGSSPDTTRGLCDGRLCRIDPRLDPDHQHPLTAGPDTTPEPA